MIMVSEHERNCKEHLTEVGLKLFNLKEVLV
jgi:hypothetical protein